MFEVVDIMAFLTLYFVTPPAPERTPELFLCSPGLTQVNLIICLASNLSDHIIGNCLKVSLLVPHQSDLQNPENLHCQGYSIMGTCLFHGVFFFFIEQDPAYFILIVTVTLKEYSFTALYTTNKNMLQEWHAYIRTMVQFHVLGEMYCKVYPLLWYQIAWDPAMGRY